MNDELLDQLKTLLGKEDNPECAVDSLDINYTLVQDIEWDDDGKYQNGMIVIDVEGRFFAIGGSRSGSYFTDWHHNIDDVSEVKEIQLYTVTKRTAYVSQDFSQNKDDLLRQCKEIIADLET